MKNKQQAKEKKYCEYCGAELVITEESAEGWSPIWAISFKYPKFNKETGEKNIMYAYRCPNGWYKTFFGKKKYDSEAHSLFGVKKNF